ncbi:MAG: hypothetical protein E7596_05090 [Ruminococcaceae bacterium]|nr:hypothetical protein [Oscillospiraceae bacterium]
MTKRKVILAAVFFVLAVMMFALTSFAAINTEVSVVVTTLSGRKEINDVTVEEIYNYTLDSNGGGYTITGIKSFRGYGLSAIKEIEIPYGNVKVNMTSTNAYLEAINLDGGSDTSGATVISLSGLTKLKKIVIGNSCDATFKANCAPASLTEIVSVGGDATITFEGDAFKDRWQITSLNFGAGNTYKLGKNCFKGIGVTNLDLVDGAVFTFGGDGAFYGCSALKTVYVGDKVDKLQKTAFDNCPNIELVYLAGVTVIDENVFRVAVSGEYAENKQLRVYNHGTLPTTIGQNAFTGRTKLGVVLCTLSTNTTSFNNCKYELYNGIPHAYTPASSTPTCYITYKTDCPCGQVKNAELELYRKGETKQFLTYKSAENPDVPHTFTSAKSISFANGINNPGVVEAKCSVCGTLEGGARSAPAIVVFLGYSVSEGAMNNKGIAVGVRFNSVSLMQYEAATGETIDFGIVLSSAKVLNGANPLKSNGEVYSSKTVYKHDMSTLGYYESTLKLTGLTSTTVDMEFVLSAYIKIGDKIYYIDNGGISEKATTVKYTSLLI